MNLPENLVREKHMIKIHEETGYLVTNDGKVLRKDGNGFLKPKLDRYGYLCYGLSLGKKKHMLHITAHKLVATVFLERPSEQHQVDHIDGNKLNNHVSNLEWVTLQENLKRRCALNLTARGERSCSDYTDEQIHEVCKMLADGYRNNDIAKACNVTREVVSQIRMKKTWIHISNQYIIEDIAHQGISNSTFLWCCYKLQEGYKYKEILDMYTGGEHLTYTCLKRIKRKVMRPHLSKDFIF